MTHVWNMRIGDKAFKEIVPQTLEIKPEVRDESTGFLWWRKESLILTGRWYIRMVYNKSPYFSAKYTDHIYFDSEQEARAWYDEIFAAVFLGQKDGFYAPPSSPPPSKNPKKNPLRLV